MQGIISAMVGYLFTIAGMSTIHSSTEYSGIGYVFLILGGFICVLLGSKYDQKN